MGYALREEQFLEIFLAAKRLPKGESIHSKEKPKRKWRRKSMCEMCSGMGTSILYKWSGNACFWITCSYYHLSAFWCSHIGHAPPHFLSKGSPRVQAQLSAILLQWLLSENASGPSMSLKQVGTSGLGVEGGEKKKKRKKRDCCWRFRRTPKATSNALNVHHFKWWHSHIFSNWFFKRLNYTRTK